MEYINGSELANKRFIKLDNGDLREVQGKYVPKYNELYHYLGNCGRISFYYNRDNSVDEWILKHNLVFRTEEECKDYKKFLETLDEYAFEPDWNDEEQEKWYLEFNHRDCELMFILCYYMRPQCVCFQSKERGEAFVEKVGEEAVERYMFDYWR